MQHRHKRILWPGTPTTPADKCNAEERRFILCRRSDLRRKTSAVHSTQISTLAKCGLVLSPHFIPSHAPPLRHRSAGTQQHHEILTSTLCTRPDCQNIGLLAPATFRGRIDLLVPLQPPVSPSSLPHPQHWDFFLKPPLRPRPPWRRNLTRLVFASWLST